MDATHYLSLVYLHQMNQDVQEALELALMSGAMPGDFRVVLRRQRLGVYPRFIAFLE